MILVQCEIIPAPIGSGKTICALMLLNLLYMCYMPLRWSRFHKVAKTNDVNYMDLFMFLIPSRFISMTIGALWQVENIYFLFGMEIFAVVGYIIWTWIRNERAKPTPY